MKYYRLKKQADFQRLFHKGKRAATPSLSVIYRPSEKMVMGISIGDDVIAGAVARYEGKMAVVRGGIL